MKTQRRTPELLLSWPVLTLQGTPQTQALGIPKRFCSHCSRPSSACLPPTERTSTERESRGTRVSREQTGGIQVSGSPPPRASVNRTARQHDGPGELRWKGCDIWAEACPPTAHRRGPGSCPSGVGGGRQHVQGPRLGHGHIRVKTPSHVLPHPCASPWRQLQSTQSPKPPLQE